MDTATDPQGRPFALDVIRPWPDVAREAAYQVILVHGPPDVVDERSLRWDGLGPWKRVVVCADDGDDDPDDVIESVIDATIPAARRADVDAVATEFRVVDRGRRRAVGDRARPARQRDHAQRRARHGRTTGCGRSRLASGGPAISPTCAPGTHRPTPTSCTSPTMRRTASHGRSDRRHETDDTHRRRDERSMSDEQDRAEALDEDVVDDEDDYSGDEVGDDLPDFPPDRPLGVNTVGVTAVEEDAGESFAERTYREEPEDARADDRSDVGQLVDPDSTSAEDDEEELLGEAEPGVGLSAEEAAMHIEPER